MPEETTVAKAISMFVCTNADVNAKIDMARIDQIMEKLDLRDELLGIWGMVQVAKSLGFKKLHSMDLLLNYGLKHYSRKRKTPVDVPKLIAEWKTVVVTLATAHDKADVDKAEFRMDELLTPLLSAPVAQLREFYTGLTKALREDPNIPFFVWSMFNAWSKGVLDKCESKTELKELRKKLANEIAEMVDSDIKPDIMEAVAGALMWRDPETLEAIKSDLKAGAKPKLKGRESCLFLTTQLPGKDENLVML